MLKTQACETSYFSHLNTKKTRLKHKFLNKYSITKRTLYCKWASFKFSILLTHFIILFKLLCSGIHQFLLLTWKHLRNILFGLASIIDYMSYFQPVDIEWKSSSVCSNRGEISGLPWWSFCIYHNSIFTLFLLIMRDKISSRFNELKFQPGL